MRRMLTGVTLALIFVAGEEGARANGDPASHVLPSREVFVPFDPSLCSAAGRRLDALTEAMRKAGYPIKVAVIPTGEDLGTLYRLFGRPQAYARVLARDLPRHAIERRRGRRAYRLLVVMPGGLALNRSNDREARVLRRTAIDAEASREDLVRLSIDVVSTLSRATGHRVAAPKPKPACPDISISLPSSSSDSGPWGTVLIVVVVLAMVALAWFFGARGRTPRQSG
jgi:hypothetical protein